MPYHSNARADGEAVGFGRLELQREPVAILAHLVAKEPHRSVVVGYNNVDSAVVIDVAERSGTAYFLDLKGRARHTRDLTERLPTALVMKQLLALGIRRCCGAIGFRE